MATVTLEEMIVKAENREYDDDHLTNKERQVIVDAFIAKYKEDPYVMGNFPMDDSLDEQYCYIIFEF